MPLNRKNVDESYEKIQQETLSRNNRRQTQAAWAQPAAGFRQDWYQSRYAVSH